MACRVPSSPGMTVDSSGPRGLMPTNTPTLEEGEDRKYAKRSRRDCGTVAHPRGLCAARVGCDHHVEPRPARFFLLPTLCPLGSTCRGVTFEGRKITLCSQYHPSLFWAGVAHGLGCLGPCSHGQCHREPQNDCLEGVLGPSSFGLEHACKRRRVSVSCWPL